MYEMQEVINSLRSEISDKRKYGEVILELRKKNGEKSQNRFIIDEINDYVGQDGRFKSNDNWREVDYQELHKILRYALTKQMVHDLEAMSQEDADIIINKFINLFELENRRLFTNARFIYDSLSWNSIMKESKGVVYFDTGVVIVTGSSIGIMWLADKG